MRKTIVKSLIAGFLFYCLFIPSLFLSTTSPAVAATAQKENTIILQLGKVKKDDVDDLRYGEGKIMKKIEYILEELQDSGQLSENYQPIIVITKKKAAKDW